MTEDRAVRQLLEETQQRLREAETQLAEVTALRRRMDAIEAALARARNEVQSAPPVACLRCGSTAVAQAAPVAVRGRAGQEIFAVAIGDPEATFDKEPLYAEFAANVCGACGSVELTTKSGEALYETWQRGMNKRVLR